MLKTLMRSKPAAGEVELRREYDTVIANIAAHEAQAAEARERRVATQERWERALISPDADADAARQELDAVEREEAVIARGLTVLRAHAGQFQHRLTELDAARWKAEMQRLGEESLAADAERDKTILKLAGLLAEEMDRSARWLEGRQFFARIKREHEIVGIPQPRVRKAAYPFTHIPTTTRDISGWSSLSLTGDQIDVCAMVKRLALSSGLEVFPTPGHE